MDPWRVSVRCARAEVKDVYHSCSHIGVEATGTAMLCWRAGGAVVDVGDRDFEVQRKQERRRFFKVSFDQARMTDRLDEHVFLAAYDCTVGRDVSARMRVNEAGFTRAHCRKSEATSWSTRRGIHTLHADNMSKSFASAILLA